jgi:very-short-patch-repair endonuclease
MEEFVATHRRYASRRLEMTLDRCESPLEKLLAMAILNQPYMELQPRSHWTGRAFAGDDVLNVYLQHQEHISGRTCRLDFALITPRMQLNVEVDGHEFHERTKEQARRDKSRDRALTAKGWTVLRFTGQEVWEDAVWCAQQIWAILMPGRELKE